MPINSKKLRPKDISRPDSLLSPVKDLRPLPAPYDKPGMEPDLKPLKEGWAEKYCTTLDGFIALDTLKRPESKAEEEKFVQKFLSGMGKIFSDANRASLEPLYLTIDYCAKCNTCTDACHIYRSSGGNEPYRPIFRSEVFRRIYKKYLRGGGSFTNSFTGGDIEITWESIARLAEDAYRCNLCRRCAQACPLGLDNGMLTREIRKLFSQELGLAPSALHEKGTMRQLKTGSSTGITKAALLDTLEFIEEDTEEKIGRKIKFPMDKKGADILLIHNAGEFMAWPENPAAFAVLFDEAGLDWTLSSEMIGYDSVNYGIWYDDTQAKKIAMQQLQAAKDLGVRRIVVAECGHAHKAIALSADRMTTDDKVPVESCLPILAELAKSGKLKMDASKNPFPVTLHDPCNIVRQMGIVEPQREVLRQICPDFREMTPHGVDNYCCGGGSGFAIMNSCNFGEFRNKVSARTKFEQILKAFGEADVTNPELVKYVCAPCSNCKGTIRDLLEYYGATAKFNIHYGGLVELMVNALVSLDKPFLTFDE